MVRKKWKEIDDELEFNKIGRKDTPFDQKLMDNMLTAWEYIDFIIRKRDYSLFGERGGVDMLEINHRVHYGLDSDLRKEYRKAISATTEKFEEQIKPIRRYYKKNLQDSSAALKVAAGIYIAILGAPQLYIEGNHRSGSISASWINLVHNQPPFVLTVDNAIAFFKPAQEIKKFNKRSVWRSVTKLPKYKKDFKIFWEKNCDMEFIKK